MTTQLPKDPVTLDDLKRAIEEVPEEPEYATWDGSANDFDVEMDLHVRLSRNAWRTAFEWREQWWERYEDTGTISPHFTPLLNEGREGMRLIREKLS